MIHSFEDDMTEEVYNGIYSHEIRKKLSPQLVKMAERKLDILNSIHSLEDLTMLPVCKRNEEPVRDVHGKYSFTLWGEYRIAFRWNEDKADDVQILS